MAKHVKEWEKLTSDPWIINNVRGVTIPFVAVPVQEREPRPYRLSEHERDFVDLELEELLQKGIIEESEESLDQIVSNIFLRPKKDGSYRMILDLTWVNEHIEYEHFKMESLHTALGMVRQDSWMGSIDLKDAYYSVPIREDQRCYLRFRWGNRLFQFKVLPNGLACAPRIFTKLLKPVFASLRERGLECFPYIDDSFVIADDKDTCQYALTELKDLLERLGFVVHPVKSELTPKRSLVFLGFNLDSEEMQISLTEDKEEKLERAIRDLLGKDLPSIREVAGLVGLMESYSVAVPYGSMHAKRLEMEKIAALAESKGDFDQRMSPSQEARQDCLWWLLNARGAGNQIRRPKPDFTMFADASNEGWGAHVGEETSGGRWAEEEKEDYINVLELKAILLGLQSLCRVKGCHIRIMTDNTTALAYVAHQGGVRSLRCQQVAKQIWFWAEENENWLSIAHIPGVENVLADHKSRHFADNLEWELNPKLFQKIIEVLGSRM